MTLNDIISTYICIKLKSIVFAAFKRRLWHYNAALVYTHSCKEECDSSCMCIVAQQTPSFITRVPTRVNVVQIFYVVFSKTLRLGV